MTPALRNPLALLAFSALCVIGAVTLLLAGHDVPVWLQTLCGAGVLSSAAVMTPGLATVERLLGLQLAAQPALAPAVQPGKTGPATIGLSAADLEPAP